MAQSTVIVLVPYTSHTGTNPLNITSDRQPAAAYYVANRGLQTIIWNLGNNIGGTTPTYFVGVVTIQASLASTPGAFDWFDVYTVPVESNSDGQSGYYNLSGNYVWIRSVVTQWTAGPIQSIAMSY